MAGDGTAERIRRLGGADYDPVAKSIRVDRRVTLLDPRAADAFALLVERFGERVSKEELLATAWRGRLVHENSIAKVISRLRAALHGSGLAITASYGVGYVLHEIAPAPATEEEGADAPAPEPEPVLADARAFRRPALVLLAGALAATLLAALFVPPGKPAGGVPIRTAWPATNDPPDAIATLLWVDDHPNNNRLEVAAFERRRLAVHLAQSSDDALKLLAINRYQLVISDLGRGDDRLAGLRMIEEMKRRGIAVPVLIYTLRPKTADGQAAQHRLIHDGGAADLAVTPQEVRSKVLGRFGQES